MIAEGKLGTGVWCTSIDYGRVFHMPDGLAADYIARGTHRFSTMEEIADWRQEQWRQEQAAARKAATMGVARNSSWGVERPAQPCALPVPDANPRFLQAHAAALEAVLRKMKGLPPEAAVAIPPSSRLLAAAMTQESARGGFAPYVPGRRKFRHD